jgi:hypothetical protein
MYDRLEATREAIRRSLEREDPGCVNYVLYRDMLPVGMVVVDGPLRAPQETQNKLRALIRKGGAS